jgi:hypothetical protein
MKAGCFIKRFTTALMMDGLALEQGLSGAAIWLGVEAM